MIECDCRQWKKNQYLNGDTAVPFNACEHENYFIIFLVTEMQSQLMLRLYISYINRYGIVIVLLSNKSEKGYTLNVSKWKIHSKYLLNSVKHIFSDKLPEMTARILFLILFICSDNCNWLHATQNAINTLKVKTVPPWVWWSFFCGPSNLVRICVLTRDGMVVGRNHSILLGIFFIELSTFSSLFTFRIEIANCSC